MKLKVSIITLATSVSLALSTPLNAQEDTLQKLIKPFLEKAHTTGLVVGTVTKAGSKFYQFGHIHPDSGRKPQPTDYFSIGSITKVFTTLILQDQVMKGRVSLDDPVSTFLPDSIPMPEREGQVITLKHLATHTSGLPRIDFGYSQSVEGRKHRLNPYKAYNHEELYDFLMDYDYPQTPGDSFRYSNLGMALLGHVLEKITEKPYEKLIREYAQQMGMDHTTTQLKPEEKSAFLTPYNGRGEATPAWDYQVVAAAGAIRSTPKDMLHFVKANLGLVETPHNKALARSRKPIKPLKNSNDSSGHIGLGWLISGKPIAGGNMIFHSGGTYGFRAFAGFLKEQKVGVVLMTNSLGKVTNMGAKVLRAVAAED
jgi:D-alanyl-D-alanine-carboxypeptidase/D-alanyl-D-alanine-endopeptidase